MKKTKNLSQNQEKSSNLSSHPLLGCYMLCIKTHTSFQTSFSLCLSFKICIIFESFDNF